MGDPARKIRMPYLNSPGISRFNNLLTAPLGVPAALVAIVGIACFLSSEKPFEQAGVFHRHTVSPQDNTPTH